jgi:uncharacterized membrane protein YfcA
MTEAALPLVVTAVFVGAAAQRITGVGFALTVAPFLVLAYGPFSGVLVLNLIAAVSALLLAVRTFRDIEWRKYLALLWPALLGIPAGAWVASVTPTAWLEVAVGAFLLISLGVSVLARRLAARADGTGTRSVAGFLTGALSASVGVGGPALTIYAVLSRWEHRSFVATAQPYLMSTAFGSFVTKLTLAPGGLPEVEWWFWLLIGTAMIAGLGTGDVASRRLPAQAVRYAVLGVAAAGGVITGVRGVLNLLS